MGRQNTPFGEILPDEIDRLRRILTPAEIEAAKLARAFRLRVLRVLPWRARLHAARVARGIETRAEAVAGLRKTILDIGGRRVAQPSRNEADRLAMRWLRSEIDDRTLYAGWPRPLRGPEA